MSGPSSPSERRRAWWLAASCALAFALSWAYLHFYLRGGPRIIDATSYFLEARSLAAGGFSFQVPDPTASFRGRFLLASSDGHQLGVIFPPGYPFVLSLGVRLGAPLLVGPALGALLVAATYALARALGQATRVAMLAAVLSALCAALRYHTADTMSHGLATLLGCGALCFALRRESRSAPWLAGSCLGLLVATRPVSGAVACLLAFACVRGRVRAWPALALGMLPGVLLLLAQQRALTGSWLGSTQLAYYQASDAPAGCFRYGFGAGIGCRFEHGQYVSQFLADGFGLRHALRNLGVHLLAFSTDATNAAPLSLLAGYALGRHWRSPLGLLGAGIALQALAYVPFYFDGDYPGGGARFLCEAIPFCQILVARAAWDLRLGWLSALAALAGFGLYARHGHEQLREREGGRPMFEPALLARSGIEHGLVLVGSDHGFNLGRDPSATDPRTSVVVARARGDAHDRELYERLGRPPTYRYVYDFSGKRAPHLVRVVPEASRRLEAEAEWPALLTRGSAYPIHFPCASGSKALRLLPGTAARFWVPSETARVAIGWVNTGPGPSTLRVGWSGTAASEQLLAAGPGCSTLSLEAARAESSSALLVELVSGSGALDFVELEPRPPG
ncbi:MAG TPA: hypothetical protein VEQ58_22980 [Polyangiaceae bacterium]|nr:hypothetical protein [Polyangiaceae bacterium]